MPGYLRQSTATQSRALGPFVDETDFKTPETGLTIANADIKLIINGAASVNKNSGGGTHRANGVYGVTFDATDTATVGELDVSAVVAGALPVFDKFFVLPQAIYDWLTGVIVPLPANVTQLLGTTWLTPGTAGTPDVNAKLLGATAQTGRDVGASVLLSTGTGTGQLDFTSGVVKANLAQILGTALTETAGLLAGGFKKFFNIISPVSTMDVLARVTLADTVTTYTGNTPQTGDNFARLGAPAGASISADVAAVKTQTAAIETDTAEIGTAGAGLTNIDLPNQTMNITGNLSGSVGSVTAGVTLAASAIQAIWDALTSALTTVGSIGKLLVDNINATITSRASQTSVDDLPTNAELATAIAPLALEATSQAIGVIVNDVQNQIGTAGAGLTDLGGMSTGMKAEVNLEVVDALNVDTYGEPTGVPPATTTLVQKIGRLHMALRNGLTVTATDKTFLDDGGAAEWKKPLADDGTTYTEGEGATP